MGNGGKFLDAASKGGIAVTTEERLETLEKELATAEHAPTAEGVRKTARLYGIRLLNRGGRPPKHKRGGHGAARRSGNR